ncbi:MAG: hypothetical protein ACRCY8_10755 [Dermatophilaceae bacterium]
MSTGHPAHESTTRTAGSTAREDAERTGRNGGVGRGPDDATDGSAVHRERAAHRATVVAAEKEQFGGIKAGSAFFGWLTATGTAVLLTALLAAAGTAVGLATDTDVDAATDQVASEVGTIGIAGAVALFVILFGSYYCGGYVAGRMARFDGAKQGLAVWLWALLVAGLVALLGAVAGNEYNVLAELNTFPRIPVGEGDLSTAGLVAAAVAVLASLAGAVLGGLAGMRYHRKVDRAGLGD